MCKKVAYDCAQFCFIPQLLSIGIYSHTDNHFKNELDGVTGWGAGTLPMKVQGWGIFFTEIPASLSV